MEEITSHPVMPGGVNPVIIVQGGAGSIPEDLFEGLYHGVQEAVKEGYKTLLAGSAVDAVERAVCCLEDNPNFNAGCGSVLNAAGEVEMDAIIAEGETLRTGAVACAQNVKNPVKLARMIMDKTEHHFLIGQGFEAFIDEMGVQRVNPDELMTERTRRYQKTLQGLSVVNNFGGHSESRKADHDTVGAVAIDKNGNIACATSTGGLRGQRVGRVGDSPIIGSGAYCDNAVGGVSTTGKGEQIMRISMASRVILYMEKGCSAQEAARKTLQFMEQRTGGTAGMVVVTAEGEAFPYFTTTHMSWATAKDNHITYGVEQGKVLDGGCALTPV